MPFPSPLEIKKLLPLDFDLSLKIKEHRTLIQEIISGKETRLALVVGPCSLHNLESAIAYAKKLKDLQHQVEKSCLLIMRAHVEKPRTCLGWKGLLYDPRLDGSNEIELGLFMSRQILLELVKMNVPIATEFLDPLTSLYFSDLVSWGFIGARTSSSQTHRQLASNLSMPIGFKNATDGNLESAIHGALAAQSPHTFIHVDESGKIYKAQSSGNSFSHIVLRGSTESPNYSADDVQKALDISDNHALKNRILVDCSHGNSNKNPFDQKNVCKSVLHQYLAGNHRIMGLMIESHLESGTQSLSSSFISPSISLTDPCINWPMTEELILSVDELIQNATLLCPV